MNNSTLKILPNVVLGVLFVISGFVKAIDPMGLKYKIEEYLGMFQLSDLNVLCTPLSVILCATEVALGLFLLLRLWRKTTSVIVMIFILSFTVLTYRIYTDPYNSITECGCFGEALHFSNGATFAKNIFFLIVAGVHLWIVFRQNIKMSSRFHVLQMKLTSGILIVSFSIPLYAYLYLPPFDFLPYNVGDRIGVKNAINLYDSDFNDVTEEVFASNKPTYMICVNDEIRPLMSCKIAALYEAYRTGAINLFVTTSQNEFAIKNYGEIPVYFIDNVVSKSILRTRVGVIAFMNDRIVGKWNLVHTPYRFKNGYGDELCGERLKIVVFFCYLLIAVALLFYGRKKIEVW